MSLLFTMLVPFLMLAVAVYGLCRKVDLWGALVQGAGDGLGVLLRIVPALIGLMTAVYMLRASGALELAASLLAPSARAIGLPEEVIPLALMKPISGSGATALLSEIFHSQGADSFAGRVASVLAGSTETWRKPREARCSTSSAKSRFSRVKVPRT